MLAVNQLHFIPVGAVVQPRGLRRTRRANLYENLAAVVDKRLIDRTVADPVDVAQHDPAHAQRFTRADNDAATLRVEPYHVQRHSGGDSETATLPDGEMNNAGMAAKHLAVEIHDVSGLGSARPEPLDHIGVVTRRHKTDVLTVVLVGNRKAETASELACFHLGALAERKAKDIELLPGRAEKEIALIALLLPRAIKGAAAAGQWPRCHVVTGRENLGAQFPRGDEQIVELDRHIAVDAGHRRFAVNVALGEAVDHGLLEAAFVVEHVMRNADAFRNAARVIDVLTGAAGPLAVGRGAMIVELQGDPDDVIALRLEQGGRDRGIDATGHGDDDASVCGPAVEVETVGHNVSYHRWRWNWRNASPADLAAWLLGLPGNARKSPSA